MMEVRFSCVSVGGSRASWALRALPPGGGCGVETVAVCPSCRGRAGTAERKAKRRHYMDGLTVGFLACVGRSRGVVGMIEVARSPVEEIGGDDGNGRKGSEVVWRSGALSRNGAKMWPADGLLETVACVRCERGGRDGRQWKRRTTQRNGLRITQGGGSCVPREREQGRVALSGCSSG